MFTSHIVQIKLFSGEFKVIRAEKFTSHIVQIKLEDVQTNMEA